MQILKLKAKLAEGLFWDVNSELLYGVDIEGQSIWRTSPSFSFVETKQLTAKVGWCIRIHKSEFFLVGMKDGISFVDSSLSLSSEKLCSDVLGINQRFNDAKADILGNIWGGVMDDSNNPRSNGFLYKLSPDGVTSRIDDGYWIPNGPVFSLDSSYMLHTDSWLRTIYIYDFDRSLGLVKNKRIWKNFPVEDGFPDGMCFDSEGCVWVAHWGGGKISRYDIDGSIISSYHFPVSHVSNVCFGGGDLSHLFITSATMGLDANQIEKQSQAGNIFKISNLRVSGLPPFLASESFVNLFNEN